MSAGKTSDASLAEVASTPPMPAGLKRAAELALMLVGVLAAVIAVQSLRWEIHNDAALMCYVAQGPLVGETPYRDAMDTNLPGMYLCLQPLLLTPGDFDLKGRVLDLALMATISALAALLVDKGTPWRGHVIAGVVVLTSLYYLSLGAWMALQREAFMLPCELLALWLLARATEGAPLRVPALIAAGFLTGFATTIKPFGVVAVGPAVLVAAVIVARRERWFAGLTLVVWFALGGMLAALAVGGWLAAHGGVNEFFDILFNYTKPLYSQLHELGSPPEPRALAGYLFRFLVFNVSLDAIYLATFYLLISRAADVRGWMLMSAVGGSMLQAVLQAKGFDYHLMPIFVFGIPLLLSALAHAWSRASLMRLPLTSLAGCSAVIIALTALAMSEMRDRLVVDATHDLDQAKEVRALVEFLRPRLTQADGVQVIDSACGGLDALYRLGVRQATSLVYDFMLVSHDSHVPFIAKVQKQFMDLVRAKPPRWFIISRASFPTPTEQRIEGFPEFAEWLRANYDTAYTSDLFLIFERRNAAGAGGTR